MAVVALAKPTTHLSFLSTIVKGWHRLWAGWSQNSKHWQFTGIQIMVQRLVTTSSLTPKSASQQQAWARLTLFHLQWRTAPQSWRGVERTFHLIRWRYFILTHPAKSVQDNRNWVKLKAKSCIWYHPNLFFSLFIYRTKLISGIRKCKVVKRNHQKKAQRQRSNSKNLIVWICSEYWIINCLPSQLIFRACMSE